MNRNILMGLTLSAVVALVLWSCDSQPEVPLTMPPAQIPQQMTPQGIPQAPGMQPPGVQPPGMPPAIPQAPVAEAPLPRTELIPISDEVEEETPKKVAKGGTGICKLPGPETPGTELLGNYQCTLTLKKPILGLQPPPFGCSIRKRGDKVILTNTGSDVALNGPITETKAAGFRLQGNFKYSALKLSIGSCMKVKGVGNYKGPCTAVLNEDKKNKLSCTLEIKK